MTFKQAIKKIVKNWDKLEKETIDGFEAVWFVDDTSMAYEVDEERIGIMKDGGLVWGYASGCSCWGGEYDTSVIKTIKAFKLTHDKSLPEWEAEIIKFSEQI